MKILVIGSGGREHALVWKIKQSPLVTEIYCAPGNPGMATLAKTIAINPNDFTSLVKFARDKAIDLTVVGPEDPLVNGIVDYFTGKGLKIFGPDKAAAQLEGSKVFAKNIMQKYNIPTAAYRVFSSFQQASHYLDQGIDFPVVIKASGLAAGKGVLICQNKIESQKALQSIMDARIFGSAGDEVVVEEFLSGNEVSIFALCDGNNYLLLSPSQDHKKVSEGDRGKNTGGMGAYAPTPIANETFIKEISKTIIVPSLQAMLSEGIPYKGLLYFGLIVTNKGPMVLEYNCRFGDPETEVVLPILASDLVPLLVATTEGALNTYPVEFFPEYAIDVVLASGGYPDSYEKGKPITGLENLDTDIMVFHAGTSNKEGKLITSGGRVLNIIARGKNFIDTRNNLYQNINKIHFDGMQYRKDIGYRVLDLFSI
jgi:phosphoribosylamine--glycine ligase